MKKYLPLHKEEELDFLKVRHMDTAFCLCVCFTAFALCVPTARFFAKCLRLVCSHCLRGEDTASTCVRSHCPFLR